MQTQRLNITLPDHLAKKLRLIPSGKRSQFIARALSDKLGQKIDLPKELAKSLKKNFRFYQQEAQDWQGIEDEGWGR